MSDAPAPSVAPPQPGTKKPSRPRSTLRFVRDLLVIVLIALLVSFLLKSFVVRSFYIPSGSMENTLMGGPGAPDNDRVLVEELEPRIAKIHRGDVVVFADPGGWLPPVPTAEPASQNPFAAGVSHALDFVGLGSGDSNQYLVKRVIGLPGDHVTCCGDGGRVTVNGVPLNEPYLKPEPAGSWHAGSDFNTVVPAGELWVLGDNRLDSDDSSGHQNLASRGFVPEKDVVGRAIAISWPASRWTWLGDYPTVFAKVPDPGTAPATSSGAGASSGS